MAVQSTASRLMTGDLLRFLVLLLALTLTGKASAQQIGETFDDARELIANTVVNSPPISEAVPVDDVQQRLRETEARLRRAEERLAENEERWLQFASPVDVAAQSVLFSAVSKSFNSIHRICHRRLCRM